MALKIYDTVKPVGTFPVAEASDIKVDESTRLDTLLAVLTAATKEQFLTQAEYDAIVASGTLEPNVKYYILEDSEEGAADG